MKHFLTVIALSAISFAAGAQEFFDTNMPDRLFSFGVRAGFNTSVRTIGTHNFNSTFNKDSWGLGAELGIVAHMNFRNWISVEPGFFYTSRSNAYSYVNLAGFINQYRANTGNVTRHMFTIPVVMQARLNIAENLQWLLDFGPYLTFTLKDKKIPVIAGIDTEQQILRPSMSDFGLKMGTGLSIRGHYYIGIHYLAGCTSAWKDNLGGHDKSWTFTLGYDF